MIAFGYRRVSAHQTNAQKGKTDALIRTIYRDYGQIRGWGSAGMEALPFVENVDSNTIVTYLQSHSWYERKGSPIPQLPHFV